VLRGDSFVAGYAGRVQGEVRHSRRQANLPSWPALTSYNLGIRGDTSRDVLDCLAEECRLRLPRSTIEAREQHVPIDESSRNLRLVSATRRGLASRTP